MKFKHFIGNYIFKAIVLFITTTTSALAQEVLSLDDVLKLALQNNYAIKLAKIDADVASNNNRLGAAGMLPVITGTANQDNQVVNSYQKFLNGTENNRKGAQNNSMSANVELGWNIFDGFKMFATKNKLEELQQIGELKMRQNIELTFVRITKAYMDVVLSQMQMKAAEDLYNNSLARQRLVNDKYTAGKVAKTELLKASVDVNTDNAAFMRLQNTLKNAKLNLNQLLARDLNTPFAVPDSLKAFPNYQLNELTQKVTSQNASLLMAKKNQRVNLLSVREINAERMPTIQLKSGYNYNRQESQAGFLQSSQNNGFHYGAGLSINLFNGFDVNRRLFNANANLKYADLVYNDSLTRLQTAITQAYNNYTTTKNLVDFEKANVEIAKENYLITNEQYKLGVITSIELRDAQQNLMNSELRLFNAQYETKLNETEILRLSGELVKF